MDNPNIEDPQAWRAEAKCARPESYPHVELEGGEVHPAGEVWHNLFYPPREGHQYQTVAVAAKSLCYGTDGRDPCPVRDDCLLQALRSDESHGILGGKSHRERNAILRRHLNTHPELDLEGYVRSRWCK